jgi:hypothetical protein
MFSPISPIPPSGMIESALSFDGVKEEEDGWSGESCTLQFLLGLIFFRLPHFSPQFKRDFACFFKKTKGYAEQWQALVVKGRDTT